MWRCIVLFGMLGTIAAFAADDPVAARKELMKGNGKATKTIVGMLKGTAPFELVAVQYALKVYVNTAQKAPALWPDTTKGAKSSTLPDVFDNKKDFEARFARLAEEAKAAQSNIKDEASFKATFPAVLKNCGGCHEHYRAKES